jgi:hypothetical protein
MRMLRKQVAHGIDFGLCMLMNRLQRRHRLDGTSRAALENYLEECEGLTREQFYAGPAITADTEAEAGTGQRILHWETPHPSGWEANDRVHAWINMPYPGAPVVFLLHALASTDDEGWRGWGRRFQAVGWNACLLHLPYHFSRTPRGHANGELAVTADLVRTGQGLRQGVTEVRQVMAWLRERGVKEFGVWATSYGGWVGALLLGVERDFRFAVLQTPIVNVEHAIWESGISRHMRKELKRCGVTRELVRRHDHLTSPAALEPLCGAERVVLAAGIWDRIVLASDIAAIHAQWSGSALINVEQGHFGYQMAEDCFRHLGEKGFLDAEKRNGG